MSLRNPVTKHLLILGASSDQLPIYHAAQKMGCYIIAVDRNENACARPFADEFLHLGIADPYELLSALNDTPIDGIVSPGTDASLESVYTLSHKFDLPNKPALTAVKSSCNKSCFLTHVSALGLDCPQHTHAHDFEQLRRTALQIGYPVIVKPIDSSGNKGLTYIESPEGFEAAFQKALHFSSLKEVAIEEYIEGVHYAAEVFRLRGNTILLAMSERIHTSQPYFLVRQHFMPPVLSEEINTRISTAIDRICDRLEIANGPANFDFIVTDNQQVYFLELNARLGGNGMPDLVKLAYGLDTYELTLKLALGEHVDEYLVPTKKIRHAGLGMITSESTGSFVALEGLDTMKGHPAFIEAKLFVNPGDSVSAYWQENQKLGYVLVAHEETQHVKETLDVVKASIKVNVHTIT